MRFQKNITDVLVVSENDFYYLRLVGSHRLIDPRLSSFGLSLRPYTIAQSEYASGYSSSLQSLRILEQIAKCS